MRLVFAGTPAPAVVALNALAESGHELVAVVTRPDAPAGRGRALRPSPVADRAVELGLEVLKPVKPSEPEFLDRLRELAPDCCPVVAYGAMVPKAAREIPTHGWVNLHFSVLPAWRGAAPVQWAVLSGDDVTGATTFELVRELDAGPVYGTLTEPVGSTDTSGDLLERLAVSGSRLLIDTLDGIAAGTLQPQPQPDDGVTLAPKLTAADAELDWSWSTVRLDRVVRGCSPAPGAWTTLAGERFKVLAATPGSTDDGSADGPAPGELVVDRDAVHVTAGDGRLRLDRVQPPGKKAMAAADWARGARIPAGTRLGS